MDHREFSAIKQKTSVSIRTRRVLMKMGVSAYTVEATTLDGGMLRIIEH